MPVSRRRFIESAAATAALLPLTARGQQDPPSSRARMFRHGVASGDPLTDRVILWTRVSPPATRDATGPIEVRWQISSDERLSRVVARGTAQAAPERDFTVKVDAGSLKPGATYFYAFDAGGDQSPIGRTKTLPEGGVTRLRLGQISCSNYPTGYFNVYRCLANRPDLDAVVHLGDYIYEFPLGVYADTSIDRPVLPVTETISLQDYRTRYALYRSDPDLQEAHRLHPFIVVWDDHESANDAWAGGAQNHNEGEGPWATRQAAAWRAYLEWLPIREASGPGIRLYRSFRFGDLADLVMLDTRGLRDRQVPGTDARALADPRRTLLGAEQEAWLSRTLRASRESARWRLLGQQIMFSSLTPPGTPVQNADVWDGYPAARDRVFDMIARNGIRDLAILTGDIHSSWALDVARNPWTGYNAGTGAGSVAIELVAPAVSSPPLFSNTTLREGAKLLQPVARHLKFLDGDSCGYVLLDVGRERLQADWYFVPTVRERTAREMRAASFVCGRGSSRRVRA